MPRAANIRVWTCGVGGSLVQQTPVACEGIAIRSAGGAGARRRRMVSADAFHFAAPPVWEVALSAMTSGLPLYDALTLRDVHDLFRDRYPVVEKQPAPIMLEPFPKSGDGMVPTFRVHGPDLPTRWWFKAADDADLLQIQEDCVARNWRRRELPPAEVKAYPGFDRLLSDFREIVETISAFQARSGGSPSEPVVCELVYQNMIPLGTTGGQTLPFREALKIIRLEPPTSVAALQASWLEKIEDDGDFELHIRLVMGGVALSPTETPTPMAKLDFAARRAVSNWAQVYEFFTRAHAKMRRRLIELTTEDARAIWG